MLRFTFTKEQKRAVYHLQGNLQIIACAGSGKTEVVSSRIAELIKKGAKSRSIVAFTFTEKAAEELKARIRSILDRECPNKADLGEMYVGTIHSFCFEMLKDLQPQYRGFDVLDEPKRVAFVSMPRNYYELNIESLREKGKYSAIQRFLESYDIVRMENINLDDLSNKAFMKCCRAYDRLLDEERFLDFTSMIYRLVSLLETDRSARKALRDRVKHLVVDEYQDVDPLQEKLVKQISVGCESLCVVGDDDQCIYNWRGSAAENIINFSKKYQPVARRPISENFRSTSIIIDLAKGFIKNNKRRLSKEMRPSSKQANRPQKDDLFYRHFDGENEEFTFIIDRMRSLLKTGFYDKKGEPFSLSYGDFAILTRRRAEGAKIVNRLDEEGIPCVVDVGEEVFSRPEVILGLKCLAHIFDIPYKDKVPEMNDLTVDYANVFINKKVRGRPRYPKANLSLFKKAIRRIRDDAQSVMAKGKKDYLVMGLQPYFHWILNAFGADRFEFEDVLNYHLAILSNAIADYESVWRRLRASEVIYFFGFIEGYGQYVYSDVSHNDPSLVNAVKVLTIHRAKGLEFPVVFVPGFVKERNRGSGETFVDESLYDVNRYEGDIEDERRVYYTAITRSMRYLFVTGSTRRNKKDGSPYKITFKPHDFAGELVQAASFSSDLKLERKKMGYPKRKMAGSLFPTSFSDINCFRRCGYDYLMRNIFGYQAGVPPAFGYGTRLHNILNIIYKNFITNKKVPGQRSIDELFDRHFFLRYATPRISDTMKNAGRRIIKNYIDLNKEDFTKVLETEKRFELAEDEALITGQIDLLKKLDEKGNVKEVEIIDFKTEKESKDLYGKDYKLQLRLYAIACLESLGLKPKKACIHHLDGGSKDYVPIDKPQLDRARKQLIKAIGCIVEKEFRPSPSKKCPECDWHKICSHQS